MNTRFTRAKALPLLVAGLGLASLGAATFGLSPPWPGGGPPSAVEMEARVDDAMYFYELDRVFELSSALEDQQEDEIVSLDQYLIDRGEFNKEVLKMYGHQIFHFEFPRRLGYGGVTPGEKLARVHHGLGGGLDTYSCAGCHSVGGRDGAGGPTENALVGGDGGRASSAEVRNPPAAIGLGLVQALAAEMTAALASQRDQAKAQAAASGAPVRAVLTAKGVAFGSLTAKPDGAIDTSAVEGVSADLVVRPFGWKGNEARLRGMVEEAARIHFGVQSTALLDSHRRAPDALRFGGAPEWFNPDGDGVSREMEEGSVTAVAVYLAMLEAPVIVPPKSPALLDRWAKGSALFDSIGCAGCHVRSLHLDDPVWREGPEATSGPPIVVNLLRDGDAPRGTDEVMLFSDLKRHAMGEELADRRDSAEGISRSAFLTRPLWGLAESAPYLHDGRAATIPEAILAHGGEAKAARGAFAGLPADDQRSLHVFLLSLSRSAKVRIAL